jgi:hypothetical protein
LTEKIGELESISLETMILTSERDMRDDESVVEETTEVTTIEETSNNSTTTTNSNGLRKQRKNNKSGNNKGDKRGKGKKAKSEPVEHQDPPQAIKARFAACGRCCYFLGSYTSTHGEEELETAAQNGDPGWLSLTWDQHTRNLVHKAFGVRLDVDYYHYEGCCVVCCRQFVYEADEENGAVFRVQL